MESTEKIIKLREVGKNEDYYRTYYHDETADKYYSLVEYRGTRNWNTAACNGGEPDMPLKDGVIIEIYDGEKLTSRERIKRVNDCSSVGVMEGVENE